MRPRTASSFAAVIVLSLAACSSDRFAEDGAKGAAHASTSGALTGIVAVDLGEGASVSRALATNAAGEVVGERDGRPVKWKDGSVIALGTALGTGGGSAVAVDAAGNAAGFSDGQYLLLWHAGDTAPAVIGGPLRRFYNLAMNASLEVAVQQEVVPPGGTTPVWSPLFWSEGTGLVELGHLAVDFPVTGSVIGGLSDTGHVVGWTWQTAPYHARAFVWHDGTMSALPMPAPFVETLATDVNDNDVAVGAAFDAGGRRHAVCWVGGTMIDLDPSGTEDSGAEAINDAGTIIGWRNVDGRTSATMWRSGAIIDLGAGPGSLAVAINEADVVYVYRPTGSTAFLWSDPAEGPVEVPPPSGYAVAWVASLGLHAAVGYGSDATGATKRAALWPLANEPGTSNEQIDGLLDDVGDLESSGAVSGGLAESLRSKLEGAQRQCARGNATPAGNQIRAFINHVLALIESGRLAEAEGRALVDEAERILTTLTC